MTKPQDIFAKVRHLLESWAGYDDLIRAMDEVKGIKIYLAGGALRDTILCRKEKPKDFDLFIAGESFAHVVEKMAKRGCMLRGPFGSPRWFPKHSEDQYCDLVAIALFNHGLGPCRDIMEVLRQFDFTGNAVALDITTGKFFDPLGGYSDLSSGIMRAVRFDFPAEPIGTGYTLTRPAAVWFRILHYAITLNLAIEPVTMRWLVENDRYRGEYEAFVAALSRPHPEILKLISNASAD
ncbi:MAG: hypothetical protein ACE5JU_24860 [Candidatus Binatia bacterium]